MKKNLLSLDLGKSTLGVALSRTGILITPIANFRFDYLDFDKPIEYLKQLLDKEIVQTFVLGLPLFPSGDECEMSKVVKNFAKLLNENFPTIEIVYQDERYSTTQASDILQNKGYNSKKQKKTIDQTAACLILERYLKSINQIN